MGITAKNRASFRLEATTTLEAGEVLDLVEQVAGVVKGGGKSLLTTGITNLGAQVNIHSRTATTLAMSITSGKKLVELCTFSALVSATDGATTLTVGGLETYKTQQKKFWYLIPVGPKQIYGMDPYKKFLAGVEAELQSADADASVTTGQPVSV